MLAQTLMQSCGGSVIVPIYPTAWSSAAMQALLVQPSSAAAERAFSLLANSFGDRQQNALEDYVEASVMLHYNKH